MAHASVECVFFVICTFVFRVLFDYDKQTNDVKVIETGGQLFTHVNVAGNRVDRKTVYACAVNNIGLQIELLCMR